MNCRVVENQLSDYVDGQLAPAARDRLEAHLESCAGCRCQRDELQQTLRLVSQLGRLRCPADLSETVLQRLARPAAAPAAVRSRFNWTPWFQGGFAAVGAAALLVIGVQFWLQPSGDGVDGGPPQVAIRTAPPQVDLPEWHRVNSTGQALGATDSIVLAVAGGDG